MLARAGGIPRRETPSESEGHAAQEFGPHGSYAYLAGTTGGSYYWPGGWNIWSNGYIEDTVQFPTSGLYEFQVVARGSYAGLKWPTMEVRVDQQVIAKVTVNSKNWKTFTVSGNVSAGSHRVEIAFTNDYYKPPTEDRNLYVDKVKITTK